ncbi:hypothetical protein CEUSTIGMA_g4498.t1 [Chlamydomonas eustigma]|uniref:GST C-terminal domain-containing protein n=1 Tax=Chlamydomonas eustigma TaxID=1157962 RepID=A0A250X2D1_9CHLO|nr:hypothetical protein CEUSTIGMA_g4498.t1 [Chlamydomonas eustigma]|eukprot:GAX77052.1 hypothetical protein CEUSTIGMA_g4498.t1 [Chlamydomonas eustigma]
MGTMFGTSFKSHSVPLLLTAERGAICDSEDIVRSAFVSNATLGCTAVVALEPSLEEIMEMGSSAFRSALFRMLYLFPVKNLLVKGMNITAENAGRCTEKVRAIFNEVGDILSSNGGNGYLVGDRFTSADLTFASLAALVILPEEYGADLSSLAEVADQELLRDFRGTPAGRHVMNMYKRPHIAESTFQGTVYPKEPIPPTGCTCSAISSATL